MKVDFKKVLDSYKARKNELRILEIPKRQYLMINGHGDPNTSQEFGRALEALYPVAYKLKFYSKTQLHQDYVVPPLEALWCAKDMSVFTSARDKSAWDWTLMLMAPSWIHSNMLIEIQKLLEDKKNIEMIKNVRLEELEEGLCVQTLHVGPFDNEDVILKKMHQEFIPRNNLKMRGKHHEIYFSDIRMVTPDKFRTILRQPVARN